MPNDQRKKIFTVDFDDTLMLEDKETGKYYLNPKLIPILLWCVSQEIPICIVTKRDLYESALLSLDKNGSTKTLAYCLAELEKYGIKIDHVICRHTPINDNSFEEIKKIEKEAIEKYKEAQEQVDKTQDLEMPLDIKIKKYCEGFIKKQKEKREEVEKDKIENNPFFSEANAGKKKQIEYVKTLYANCDIIHLDDDQKKTGSIIETLNKISDVKAILFDPKDKQWQLTLASEFGLKSIEDINSETYGLSPTTIAKIIYTCQTINLEEEEFKEDLKSLISPLKQESSLLKLFDSNIAKIKPELNAFFHEETRFLFTISEKPKISSNNSNFWEMFSSIVTNAFSRSDKEEVVEEIEEKKPSSQRQW